MSSSKGRRFHDDSDDERRKSPSSSKRSRSHSSSSSSSSSLMPKTTSERSAELKKRSQSFHRPMIRSVVPQSETLTIARRPQQSGQNGKRIDVLTNHFPIEFGKNLFNETIYQFDVDVEVLARDGTWRSVRKQERLRVLKLIIERENFPFLWFDHGNILFSLENLTLKWKKEYHCEMKNEKTNQKHRFRFLLINLVRTHQINDLFRFIQGKTFIHPHESVTILEILFKQYQRSDMVEINRRYFPKHQRLEDLGDGRGLATGFCQSLVLCQSGPTLNINNTFTCFYQNWNLIEFLSSYLGQDIRRKGIPEKDQPILVKKILKPLWFITTHTNQIRKYRLKSFGHSADEHRFNCDHGEHQGRQISVTEYFRERWKIQLRYSHLPLVELFNPGKKNNRSDFLPMELVQLDQWQRSIKPLTNDQRAQTTNKTVVPPGERLGNLRRIVDERHFDDDHYLKQFGIKVISNEFLKISARILSPPSIKYKSSTGNQKDVIQRVQGGHWFVDHLFNQPKRIRKWACILISEREPDREQIRVATEFAKNIPQSMLKYGIRFDNNPIEISDPASPERISLRMKEMKMYGCEVIIYILNRVHDDIYHAIKYYGNRDIGMITQCARFDKILVTQQTQRFQGYIENLVQKFNAKLDGINQIVSLTKILTAPSTDKDIFMFFGIDSTSITCSKEKPSIAAIVGSKDSTSTQYMARVVQQYSPKGKIAVEIIKDLHLYLIELLREFSLKNFCLPTKLVFYRSGVADGSVQKVLDNEIQSIRRACQEFYGHNPLPKICFLIVKKSHNTRFFVYDQQTNQCTNVQPGTVIDTDIVSPNGFDFYLNSHQAIKGTSKTTLYQVLYDDIGFSSDDIQQLTYYLCHTTVRCTKSISIPSPVYYATICVARGIKLDYHQPINSEQSIDATLNFEDNFPDENVPLTLDDVLTVKFNFEPTIVNSMWFA